MEQDKLLQPIDLIMGPVMLVLLILVAGLLYARETRIFGPRFTSLFWWALGLRLAASLLRMVITDYLVPSWGLDTLVYYRMSRRLMDLFLVDPYTAAEIFFQWFGEYSVEAERLTGHYFWEAINTSLIIRIGVPMQVLSLGSYVAIGWICTFLAFIGSWMIYRTFFRIYPRYGLIIGLAVLFLPTVTFYSTNLFKDPFCILGLGLLVNGTFLIRERGHALMPWLGVLLGGGLLALIKGYILFAFVLAYGVFWFAALELPLRRGILRRLSKTTLIVIGIGLLVGGIVVFLNLGIPRYNTASIMKRLGYLLSGQRGQDTGSGYSLPIINLTPAGFLYFLLSAFNVSLFRPYPWEVRGLGPLILFLESFPTLLFTVFILARTAVINFFLQLFKDPYLLFCFTFSAIFLIITGAFSPTFGALCRYKIPGFPFFVIVLCVVSARYFEAEDVQRRQISAQA